MERYFLIALIIILVYQFLGKQVIRKIGLSKTGFNIEFDDKPKDAPPAEKHHSKDEER